VSLTGTTLNNRTRVWIKVCGVTQEMDLQACIDNEIDSVGFLFKNPVWGENYPETIPIDQIRDLIKLARSSKKILTTLLIHERDIEQVKDLIGEANPHVIQVQPRSKLQVDDLMSIKQSFPELKVIKTVGVNIDQSNEFDSIEALIESMKDLYQLNAIDFLNLDTIFNGGGGQGKIHNWDDSKKIVEALELPCILAGGLNPNNIKEAFRSVKPFGIDVMSGVGERTFNGKRSKSIKSHEQISRLKNVVNELELVGL